jgi:lysophospholipase L1-like esterase
MWLRAAQRPLAVAPGVVENDPQWRRQKPMKSIQRFGSSFVRGPVTKCCWIALLITFAGTAGIADDKSRRPSGRWFTAWGTSQQTLGATPVTNVTVRMIARSTIPGDAVRVRLDHTFGIEPLVIGRAHIGLRTIGAGLVAGSNRPLTFRGAPSVTIPPGGTVWSDALPLKVDAQQDLAVSLFLPGAGVRPSQHTGARTTSYVTADNGGDVSADEDAAAFTGTTTAMWWLKSIDVLSSSTAGAIVAFGDSITDGTCATLDAHDRWEDLVAVRVALAEMNRDRSAKNDEFRAVVNEGIGGNTITRANLSPPPDSTPGLERLQRDVLAHAGVTHVILFMGTNDIRREASAIQVIAGMTSIIKQVKARGIKIIGATIIPRHNRPPEGTNTGWNPAKTQIRNEVNAWIRTRAPFDAVIDFDRIVRDPDDPDLIYPPYDCGDGIHPGPLGYFVMGRSVDLSIFERRQHEKERKDH